MLKKLVFCWLVTISLSVQAEARQEVLVLGKVSTDPHQHYQHLKNMVDYVAARMQDLGIRRGEVLIARDNQQMIQYLREGKVDWVGETVFSGILFEQKANAEILLRRWKKGVPTYRTVFITRKDSGIRQLSDLIGKTIAFEDPGSTSAYFIPVAELLSAGLQLARLKSPGQAVPVGKIGYVFSKEEINTSTWVYKGLVDAGAYSNLNWQSEKDTPKNSRRMMTVFHQTAEMPRAIEVVRGDLASAVKARIKTILLQSAKDPVAKSVLQGYGKTSKFDSIKKMPANSLKQARRMLDIMKKEQVK